MILSDEIKKIATTITIDREKQELRVWTLRLKGYTDWYRQTLSNFEKTIGETIDIASQEQEGKVNLLDVQVKADYLKNVVDMKFEQFEKFKDDVTEFQEEYTDTIAKERKKR